MLLPSAKIRNFDLNNNSKILLYNFVRMITNNSDNNLGINDRLTILHEYLSSDPNALDYFKYKINNNQFPETVTSFIDDYKNTDHTGV